MGAVQPNPGTPNWQAQGDPDQAGRRAIGLEIQRLLGLIRRQVKLIAAVVLSITALVTVVTLQLTPIYESSALILVDPRQTNVMDPQSQVSLLPGDAARVESEVGMLRSPAVLLAVMGSLDLTQDPEFAPQSGWWEWARKVMGMSAADPAPEATLNRTLTALQDAVSVDRRGLTYLIDVKARSDRPQRAAEIANALTASHIQLQIAAKVAVATGIRDALRREVEETAAGLSQAESQLKDFYSSSIESVTDTARRAELVAMRRQADASEASRRDAESTVTSATLSLRAADWASLTAELRSDTLRDLTAKREAVSDKLARAASTDAEVDLRAQLAALEQQMTAEAQAAIDQAQQRIVSERTAGSEMENTFRQQLINELPPSSVTQLRQLQQEALASSTVYENLIAREKSVSAQENLQVPDSRVVSDAIPSAEASYPRKSLIIGLAGLASLGLAMGLAFLRENYVGGFVDEDQTEAVLGVPAFASVPLVAGTDQEEELSSHASEIVTHPLSPYSEAIRRARLSLEAEQSGIVASDGRPVQIVLVTSALPNEGKTQTAISLARSFALAGRKVLLIDADLRRPTVHKALGVQPHLGLADTLTMKFDLGSLGDVAVQDPLTNVWVIPGSPVRHNATAALLEGRRFDQLLESVAPQFDVVIIDSSPLLPVVDARLLVRFATAVVMVVRWAKTSQHDARAALNDLARHNQTNTLIGTVLNRVERTSVSYGYGRYYAPYYLEDDPDKR